MYLIHLILMQQNVCQNKHEDLRIRISSFLDQHNDDEMDQSSGLEDDAIQEYDETLLLLKGIFLKITINLFFFVLFLLDINNQINDRNSVRQH